MLPCSAAVVASLAAATTVAHAVSAAVVATLAAARTLPVHAAAVAALIAAFSFQCIYQDYRVRDQGTLLTMHALAILLLLLSSKLSFLYTKGMVRYAKC